MIHVVSPLYRTAEALPRLRDRLDAALDGAFRLVLVDDACPAGSGEVAERLAGDDPRVIVRHHRRNAGQHWAILTGLAASPGVRCVVMDADLQDPPEAVPRLLARGEDVVFATRRGRYQGWRRTISSTAFRAVRGTLAGTPWSAGLFLALSPRAVDAVLDARTGRPCVVSLAGLSGLSQAAVAVRRDHRVHGTSAYDGPLRWAAAGRSVGCVVDVRRGGRGPRLRDALPACVGP